MIVITHAGFVQFVMYGPIKTGTKLMARPRRKKWAREGFPFHIPFPLSSLGFDWPSSDRRTRGSVWGSPFLWVPLVQSCRAHTRAGTCWLDMLCLCPASLDLTNSLGSSLGALIASAWGAASTHTSPESCSLSWALLTGGLVRECRWVDGCWRAGFCPLSACHGKRGFCPASLWPERHKEGWGRDPEWKAARWSTLALPGVVGQLLLDREWTMEHGSEQPGAVEMLSQISFFHLVSKSPQRLEIFDLFTVLQRKGSWVANPQSHHKD